MSDTPETDDLVPRFLTGGEIPDLFAFCRKLERERDEAIKAFKELWQMSETLLPEISEEQSDKWHKVIFTK